MTVKQFKKWVRYRKAIKFGVHSCINCKWCNGKVDHPKEYGGGEVISLICNVNSGKKFRVHSRYTCDLCVPRRTDANYPLFPYEIPHVNIKVYE